jgi:hypothetical protein
MSEKLNKVLETTEKQPTLRDRGEITKGLVAGVGLGVAALASCGFAIGAINLDTPKTPNPEITSVSLKDGARLRMDPEVGDGDDILAELKIPADKNGNPMEVVIPTITGAYEYKQVRNGLWIGISAADIPANVVDPAAFAADSDHIAWVIADMAGENKG